ncbi:MAG: hypothetical protein Q8N98_01025 [bacterium]|nr:hypothetical protein [bacterium]
MSRDKSEVLGLESMDPTRVEQIVDEFAQKHVAHKHGAIIFVGSGGGKSTTVRNQVPDIEGKTDLLDADLMYRKTGAHPCQPGVTPLRPIPWWDMGNEVIHEVDQRCGLVNAAVVKRGLWMLTTSFTPNDECLPAAIVLLPWKEHKKRIIEKFHSEHYDAGAQPTKEGFAIVLGHRRWARRVAKEKNIPIVDSIDAAINLVRSHGAEDFKMN